MILTSRWIPRALLAGGVSVLLFSTSPAAESSEPVGEVAVDATEVQEPSNATPVLDPDGIRLNPGQLILRTIPYDPLVHRGGTYVDAGEGRHSEPNDVERAKLDRARDLVEASRAAGTLWMLPLTDRRAEAAPEDVSEIKLDRLRNQEPQLFEHPLAGVGEAGETFVPAPSADDAPGDHPTPQPETVAVEEEAIPTEAVPHE